MKTYKVKVTYTNGSTLVTEVKAKGKESLKEEVLRDKMYFIGYPLTVKEVEILSNKIDKKLIGILNEKFHQLGDYFESEQDFLNKAEEILENEGFKMFQIPSNNGCHLALINENEDVIENYKIYYVTTLLESRESKPMEIIKYNCLF